MSIHKVYPILIQVLLMMIPRAAAFTTFHKRTLAHFPNKLNIIQESNRRNKGDAHPSRIQIPSLTHVHQRWQSTSTILSNSDNIDEMDFENSGFSFEMDSFDKEGQWMSIDWNNIPQAALPKDLQYDISLSDSDARITTYSPDEPSPVQLSLVRDRMVYIKRDDLLHLHKSNVSGNKARKFLALNELSMDEFPDTIVSYGGPQSNAMVALAAIVNARNVELEGGIVEEDLKDEIEGDGWLQVDDDDDDHHHHHDGDDDTIDDAVGDNIENEIDVLNDAEADQSDQAVKPNKKFVYYTKKLPRYLRKQPNGNLLRAISLGMEIVEMSNDKYKKIFGGGEGGSAIPPKEIEPPVPMKSLWVPQGGACGIAAQGAKLMAQEIVSFWETKGSGLPLTICVPGGTCTTAMLLSREINTIMKQRNETNDDDDDEKLDILVAVIPCVGDAAYAERQMKALDMSTGGNGKDFIPQILKPWKYVYPRFGEPSPHILNTFIEMKDEHGIYLDLLYGAPAWNLLLQYVTSQRDSPVKGRQIMYVHSGGLEGISSQLTRYKHKGMIDSSQIQC